MKTLKNLFDKSQFSGFSYEVDRELMAKKAQRILDQFIEENGVKVYSNNINPNLWSSNKQNNDAHTAILLDIQPLKQCEHKEAVYVEEPKESPKNSWFKCRDCGKPVKAKGWEVV